MKRLMVIHVFAETNGELPCVCVKHLYTNLNFQIVIHDFPGISGVPLH